MVFKSLYELGPQYLSKLLLSEIRNAQLAVFVTQGVTSGYPRKV